MTSVQKPVVYTRNGMKKIRKTFQNRFDIERH